MNKCHLADAREISIVSNVSISMIIYKVKRTPHISRFKFGTEAERSEKYDDRKPTRLFIFHKERKSDNHKTLPYNTDSVWIRILINRGLAATRQFNSRLVII
ncbi:hypothetical protein GWI33_019414 [Rhynchophorus ferrugineus]|uniref:Uncharacterized protein n=1 Tax=Rhynchophorus ferrugineus TaxID=354439 RepID=A0A834M0I0_RHYFE|nr:hypothetical protein GWI33_019414 [Rhynchophorus ferrugineus]